MSASSSSATACASSGCRAPTVRQGVGKVILDVRRGIGPVAAFNYTMPVLVTSDALLERDPELVAGGMRAVIAAQRALKADVRLATVVGRALFPPAEAALIADVVARDLPYYDPAISEMAIDGLSRFAQSAGLLDAPVPYRDIVAIVVAPPLASESSACCRVGFPSLTLENRIAVKRGSPIDKHHAGESA
jgi:ABC-type nitrate/sulfonate/bicarbonate transport system substrate-binding protein